MATVQAAPSAPKILVVDDEPAILALLKTLLTRSRYEVKTAESANQALELLDLDSFDCVITDAIMPTMSGYEFVQVLRKNPKNAELPVVMLTRKRHRQDVKKAVEAGVTDYVFKPIDEALLLEKVDTWVRKSGKRPFSEQKVPIQASEAELGVNCRIESLGETSLTLRLPFRIEPRATFKLRGRILEELGVSLPELQIEHCEMSAANPGAAGEPTYPWEAKLSLAKASEKDQARIREWLQRSTKS
jgi:DNA-binding response OmpR family regulator